MILSSRRLQLWLDLFSAETCVVEEKQHLSVGNETIVIVCYDDADVHYDCTTSCYVIVNDTFGLSETLCQR